MKKSPVRLLIYREKKEYGLWAGINNNSSTGTHIWSIHNHNKIYLTNRANPRRVVVNKIPSLFQLIYTIQFWILREAHVGVVVGSHISHLN